jgi:hypothetical protein
MCSNNNNNNGLRAKLVRNEIKEAKYARRDQA